MLAFMAQAVALERVGQHQSNHSDPNCCPMLPADPAMAKEKKKKKKEEAILIYVYELTPLQSY